VAATPTSANGSSHGLRVLFPTHSAVVSGAEISLLELLRTLRPEVDAAVAAPPGHFTELLAEEDVPVFPLPASYAGIRLDLRHTPAQVARMIGGAARLRRHVQGFDASIVHANSTRAGLMAAAGGSMSVPLVVHVRDWLPRSAMADAVRRLLAARADAIVANSEFTLRAFLAGTRFRKLAAAVPNPVDTERFDPRRYDTAGARDTLGLSASAHVLAMVAQITPWKAQDDAIRIHALLRSRGIESELLLVGNPLFVGPQTYFDNTNYMRSLRTLADERGVGNSVHFLGWHDDVPQILAASDVVLLPSWREPFGRAVAEAMSMAKPVVATSTGGTREILRDGQEGLVLSPRSPRRWAFEIEQLLGDAGRRSAMGAAGRRRAVAELAPAHHARRIRSVYSRLA
jgi:L-malate glycosyltransferase